jgi:hypothetical protein
LRSGWQTGKSFKIRSKLGKSVQNPIGPFKIRIGPFKIRSKLGKSVQPKHSTVQNPFKTWKIRSKSVQWKLSQTLPGPQFRWIVLFIFGFSSIFFDLIGLN